MVAARLMGGFGNQLFQYAAGRALAERLRETLLLDLSWLNADPKGAYTRRNFELDQIHYKAKIASETELQPFRADNIIDLGLNKLGLRRHRVFNEYKHSFHSEFNDLKGNVLLNGYWQSEEYFRSVRNDLVAEISPAYHFTDEGRRLKEKVLSQNSVSVHVRRGDFVTLPSARRFHGICDMEYYKRAILHLQRVYDDLVFYVYSDDMEWCKSELSFIPRAGFVEAEVTKKSSQDMFVMSHCLHHIIANSSYSWWAAWLGRRSGTVIAPAEWFADPAIETKDIYPGGWIKM